MRQPFLRLSRLLCLTALVGLVACDDSSPSEVEESLIDLVRAETLAYESTTAAAQAGYAGDGVCVAHPDLGGMGEHWVSEARIDPEFDAMEPEAILYAPGAGGEPELVAVEYIVIDTGQDAPEFDGQEFDVGGVPPLEAEEVDHWSLHVWLHRDNPSGMFAPFNPDVSCE